MEKGEKAAYKLGDLKGESKICRSIKKFQALAFCGSNCLEREKQALGNGEKIRFRLYRFFLSVHMGRPVPLSCGMYENKISWP